jgi:hypothetical protein
MKLHIKMSWTEEAAQQGDLSLTPLSLPERGA